MIQIINEITHRQNQIAKNSKIISIDLDSIETIISNNLTNKRISRQTSKYIFYNPLFIIIKNDLNFIDCNRQIKYATENILFNLFYSFQVENFLSKCANIDDDIKSKI